MSVVLHESTSTRKSIDVLVVQSAAGVTVSGVVRWFDDEYRIPSVFIPCVYSDDARYRVALCSGFHPFHAPETWVPKLVLVEDDTKLDDEVCYLARWKFDRATDTCESVTIEVPRRVLVPMPTTYRDEPTMETIEEPVLEPGIVETEAGPAIMLDEQGNPQTRQSLDGEGNPITRTVERQVVIDGVPQFTQIEIRPEPLPDPVVHAVSSTPVLPVDSPERTESRKRRRRIRQLRGQAKVLKDLGTPYSQMSPDQRRDIQELVALLADVPLALP